MVARNRVEFRGILFGEELWSTGITFGASTTSLVDTGEGLTAWANAIATLLEVEDAWVPLQDALGVTSLGSLNQVITQYYGASGGIVDQGESTVDGFVGSGNIVHPSQTACVFSNRSDQAGRSRRGRNYWPAVGQELNGATGRLAVADRDALANAWADLVLAVADAASEGTPLVFSIYSPTLDVLTPVSAVQCGDVLDTQRRRRDSLLEVYSTVPYPGA